MTKFPQGRALKYGDNINTDIISPPAYMELPVTEAAAYAMSPIDPDFVKNCRPGAIFVAENNLGSGSSRETAPLTLKQLGITTVIAKSYARIFYRNCINLGILALECQDTDKIAYHDLLTVDYQRGLIRNETKQESYRCAPIPGHIMAIIHCGGLFGYLEQKLIATATAERRDQDE